MKIIIIVTMILTLALNFKDDFIASEELELINQTDDSKLELVTKENADYEITDLESLETTYHLFSENETKENSGMYNEAKSFITEDTIIPRNESEYNTNGLVGSDNRVKVSNTKKGPYCNTVYIKASFSDGSYKEASGFMIGPSAVATCGHCVYGEKTGKATSVIIIPAKNGNIHPYGETTAKKIIVSSEYMKSQTSANDWAVIELTNDLGSKTGWLGLRYQTETYDGTSVSNTGYPSQATTSGQSSDRYMYLGIGTIKASDANILKGNWDATSGNSGGPVFAYYKSTGYTAIGILSAGNATEDDKKDYPTSWSGATRITKDMYNIFIQYQK